MKRVRRDEFVVEPILALAATEVPAQGKRVPSIWLGVFGGHAGLKHSGVFAEGVRGIEEAVVEGEDGTLRASGETDAGGEFAAPAVGEVPHGGVGFAGGICAGNMTHVQAARVFFTGCLDKFAANAASTPPALRGTDVLINGPLCQTIAEVRFGACGGDPVGIDEDGIASAFALTGEDDELPLFGESGERIGGAAIARGGRIVVATMVEVYLAKSLLSASIIT